MAKEKMVQVQFIQWCRPYNSSELAGFPAAKARDLVTRGAAIYTHPPKGYDEYGKRLGKAPVEDDGLPGGIRHNGSGWYELEGFVDANTGKPINVKGKANAVKKHEDLLAAEADKDDG